MLRRSERIEDAGGLKLDLVGTLFAAWVICFLCIIKGIRSSGKVRCMIKQVAIYLGKIFDNCSEQSPGNPFFLRANLIFAMMSIR